MAFNNNKNKGKTTQEMWTKSVREVRRIYPEMSDREFARWYSSKWHGTAEQVLNVIAKSEV